MVAPRILVISNDIVAREMAGVAIRAYELARVLQAHGDVTLAGIEAEREPPPDIEVVTYHPVDQKALRPHIAAADVIVCQPQWAIVASWLRASGARLIYDIYDPEPLETIEWLKDRSRPVRETLTTLTLDRYMGALHDSHHLMCASDRQRDLWVGALMAQRLIGAGVYERDPSLQSVIDVVPFGVPPQPPLHSGDPASGIRARFPAIGADDEVVLWNGGLWTWLDAPTAVRGMAELVRERPQARLVFMGASHVGPARAATAETRALAAQLGLLDTHVFFNTEWVPYGRRADWLLEADCALSTHVEHLETRFAFRTRLIDCIWAGLPVVCTRGDDLAQRLERGDLGACIDQRDPSAVAAALGRVLDRGRAAYAAGLADAARDLAWPRVAAPLVRWATSDRLPPRLGDGLRERLAIRGGQRLRTHGYRAARSTLNALGLRDWPQL